MSKYSIIVPVYKVEAVLPRCIESILNQTVPDFELILIDDGSPDRSGAICDEYAAKDARIRVIHQENGGVSRARNAGLDAAQGEYVVFVDSDDYVDDEYLDTLDENDSDLVIAGAKSFDENGRVIEVLTSDVKQIRIETEEGFITFLKQWYSVQVWGKRFVRSIIEKNKLRFDHEFCFGEDSIFVVEYLFLTQDICIHGKPTYNYCNSNQESLKHLARKSHGKMYVLLQERVFHLFARYQEVQKYLVSKTIWAVEYELAKISNECGIEGRKMIRDLLKMDYVRRCLREYSYCIPIVTRWLFRLNIPELIVFRYRRR